MSQNILNLEQLLDRIGSMTEDADRVSLARIMEALGTRSFGPLLVVVGLILVSPLSIIPGMPTTMGILVFLIALQVLLHKQGLWIPGWLKKRSVGRRNADRALRRLRPVVRYIDRWIRPRMTLLVRGPSQYLIAAFCLAIALCMPLMEVVPMSASSAGLVLAAYGLSMVAYDGLLALIAFVLTGLVTGFVLVNVV